MTHKIRTRCRQRHMQKSQIPKDTRGEKGGGKKQTKKRQISNGQDQEEKGKNTKIKRPQKITSCKHSRSTDNCLDTQEGGLQKTQQEHKQLSANV